MWQMTKEKRFITAVYSAILVLLGPYCALLLLSSEHDIDMSNFATNKTLLEVLIFVVSGMVLLLAGPRLFLLLMVIVALVDVGWEMSVQQVDNVPPILFWFLYGLVLLYSVFLITLSLKQQRGRMV